MHDSKLFNLTGLQLNFNALCYVFSNFIFMLEEDQGENLLEL